MAKTCSRCNQCKLESEFPKTGNRCRACLNEIKRETRVPKNSREAPKNFATDLCLQILRLPFLGGYHAEHALYNACYNGRHGAKKH